MKITQLSQANDDEEERAYAAWLAGLPKGVGATEEDPEKTAAMLDIPNCPSDNRVVITKLAPSAHDYNRVNVFINNRFSFSLSISQVVDFKLKIGKKITPAEQHKYQQASEFGKLYQHTLEWVLARPRSISETREHLKRRRTKRELTNKRVVAERERKQDDEYYSRLTARDESYYDLSKPYYNKSFRKGKIYKETPGEDDNGFFSNEPRYRQNLPKKELPLYSDEDIEAVISGLIERKYLDDENFARYYLENRNDTKGTSLRKLRSELQHKGVDSKIIDRLIRSGVRDEETEIRKVATKKAKKYSGDKLINYLVRQGFDYQLSRAVVDEMDSQSSV